MKRVLFIFLGLFFCLNSQSENIELAIIEGESISTADFWGYVSRRMDLRGQISNAYVVEKVLEEMLWARALELEGARLKIQVKIDNNGVEKYNDFIADAIYKKITTPCGRLDKEEERKYYENNRELFRSPEVIRLSRIMLPASDVYGGVGALEQIDQWAELIRSNKKNIEEIALEAARLHVLNPQGDIGWIELSGAGETVKYLKEAKIGEVAGPFKNDGYVYLFFVLARKNSEILDYSIIASEVGRRAFTICSKQKMENKKIELFNNYHVKINKNSLGLVFKNK